MEVYCRFIVFFFFLIVTNSDRACWSVAFFSCTLPAILHEMTMLRLHELTMTTYVWVSCVSGADVYFRDDVYFDLYFRDDVYFRDGDYFRSPLALFS